MNVKLKGHFSYLGIGFLKSDLEKINIDIFLKKFIYFFKIHELSPPHGFLGSSKTFRLNAVETVFMGTFELLRPSLGGAQLCTIARIKAGGF